MQVLSNGDILVGSPKEETPGLSETGIGRCGLSPRLLTRCSLLGGIYVLTDDNHDGVSDGDVANQTLFTDSTVLPEWQYIHGIKVVESASLLYYSTENSIWSMPFPAGTRRIDTSVVVPTLVVNIPAARWTHTIDYNPITQTLLATNGRFEGNDCPPDALLGGGVYKIGGTNPINGTKVVTGCRNPMYMKCSPTWGCYAMELTGDGWGGVGGGEKMIKVRGCC
jgi:hypothetical protein